MENTGGRILVVDDEPSLLRLTCFSLQAAGYTIITAETAAEALDKVRSESPELVVLDVMLPDMSGLEVCRQIREQPEVRDVPIIMLSARAQVPDRVRGLKSGADEYVTKPVDSDELIARVERLLYRARRAAHPAPAPAAEPEPRGAVHVFVGAKGGVGTSTVAQNAAIALAGTGKITSLTELAPTTDTLLSRLGVTSPENVTPWTELPAARLTKEELAKRMVEHASGLEILPGDPALDAFHPLDPSRIETLLELLAGVSEQVVVDLACHPSEASRVAAARAESISVVVEPDPMCLLSGKATVELLRVWGVPKEKLRAILVNRAGVLTATLVSQVVPDVETRLGCPVAAVVPTSLDLALTGFKVSASVLQFRRERPFVTSFENLAGRLVGSDEPLTHARAE